MHNKSRKREIAWRLASGNCRVSIGHGLPGEIKDGIQLIANQADKSVSWVLEQVLIDYFGLKRPAYRRPKRLQQQGRGKAASLRMAATHTRRKR